MPHQNASVKAAFRPTRRILTPEQVDTCFEGAQHQTDYILALYRLVFPDFDELEKIEGFPTAGSSLSDYIWHKAIEFDTLHHPECMAGGCWMNHGFRTDNNFPVWGVEDCPVTRKE